MDPSLPSPRPARRFGPWALFLLGPPVAAQVWGARVEVPFPRGQSLPQTLIRGTGQLVAGDLDTGRGGILTFERRLLVLGPILRLEGGLEVSSFSASGRLTSSAASTLRQSGLGLALNAQFWVPFSGLAGEFGCIQRVQQYRFEASAATKEESLSRTWFRVGARWRLPLPGLRPALVASYQEPLSRDRPVQLSSVADLASYLAVQGSGQEFERLWTFGVAVNF